MKALAIVSIVVIVLLVWGLIGSSQAAKIGNTCDLGINEHGSIFCWTWHRNAVGDIQDNLDDIFDK
jgi:hypothetical protein